MTRRSGEGDADAVEGAVESSWRTVERCRWRCTRSWLCIDGIGGGGYRVMRCVGDGLVTATPPLWLAPPLSAWHGTLNLRFLRAPRAPHHLFPPTPIFTSKRTGSRLAVLYSCCLIHQPAVAASPRPRRRCTFRDRFAHTACSAPCCSWRVESRSAHRLPLAGLVPATPHRCRTRRTVMECAPCC